MTQQISVTLPDHWHRFASDAVNNRRFASIDDVIEAGLRALEADEAQVDRLERLLVERERSGDAGPWDLQAFLGDRHREVGREAA